MNNYTIYCTPEQTKKALELGAPIDARSWSYPIIIIQDKIYTVPTSEQMIGWLEEHYPIDNIDIYKQITTWHYCVYLSALERISGKGNSRKEATLAAIDAALEYLV